MNRPVNLIGISINTPLTQAGHHNSMAIHSKNITSKIPERPSIESYENVKQAQRALSDKLVDSKESSLELMKELENLANNLPRFDSNDMPSPSVS